MEQQRDDGGSSVDERTGGTGPAGPGQVGARLRAARERRGLSIEACARSLSARPRQVEALEAGDVAGFGGDVYVRGFLRTYATLLELDPDEVLRMYGQDPAFRGPVLPPREPLRIRRDPPGWLLGLVGVLAVAGVLVAVLGFGGRRVPEAVAPSDGTLDASATDVAPDDTDDAAAVERPDPAPSPAAPEGPPVDVVLTFEASSWLEVLVDDVLVEPGALVPSGSTLRFGGQRAVALRFGNAGGVRIELNEQALGPPGRPGEVVRIVLGPDGAMEPDDDAAATAGG